MESLTHALLFPVNSTSELTGQAQLQSCHPQGEEGGLESGSTLVSSVPFLLSDTENNSRVYKPRDAIFHVLTSLT